MYVTRFDMRARDVDGPRRSALYRSALDMAGFVDQHDCAAIVVSEHHFTDDGYLPSPLQMAAAIAAVTERTPIWITVAVLAFYDPVRLAEDLITLDHLSGGRVMTVFGLGYRPVEYELYGLDFADRGRIADEKLAQLLELLGSAGIAPTGADTSGTTDTDTPVITPGPFDPRGPRLAWGGGSRAAARRAGRFGIGFFAQTNAPGLQEAFMEANTDAGHDPSFCFLPTPNAPYAVFVNDDVDRGWSDVGESLLVDATSYQNWNDDVTSTASFSASTSVASLREEAGAHRVVTASGAKGLLDEFGFVSLHPLCGGLDPKIAQPYLERAVEALTGDGSGG